MSKENVKGYHFVTIESNRHSAKEFCKEYELFETNGWSNIGCAYGVDKRSHDWSLMVGCFDPNNIKDSNLITFEQFKTLFLTNVLENNNYEIY